MRHASALALAPVVLAVACSGAATRATPATAHLDLPSYAPTTAPAAPTRHGREAPLALGELPPSPLPSAHAHTLDSGLTVAVVEAHALPLVEARVVVRAGAGYAPKQPGLADLTAQLLKDGGTRGRPGAEVLGRLERLGAILKVAASADAMTLSLSVTRAHFPEAFALLAEVMQSPRFDEAELAKRKARAIAEAEDRRSNGQAMAMRVLTRELFADGSPYAVQAAFPSEIARLGPAAVWDFYRRFYVAKNVTVVIAGDVTDDAANALVARTLRGLPTGAPPSVDVPPKPAGEKRRVVVVNRPKSSQSDVFVASLGPPRGVPGWAEARVCNQILGGPDARLYADVREQRALAYSTYSRIVELAHGAQPVLAYAGTETARTADAVAALLENEERIAAKGVTDGEALAARRYLSDVLAIRMETVSAIADMTGELAALGLPLDEWSTFRAAVRGVQAAEASRAAGALFHPGAALIVVAGDADVIAPKLTAFGDVTVVDPDHDLATLRTLASEQK